MTDWLAQTWNEIAARPNGILAMRFYLQPMMAAFFALRDGMNDARNRRPAYFWALFTDRSHRKELILDGWRSIGKVFILAAMLDLIYQLIVLHGLRPVDTVVVATLLAIIPYVAVRGPVNRIARARRPRGRKAA